MTRGCCHEQILREGHILCHDLSPKCSFIFAFDIFSHMQKRKYNKTLTYAYVKLAFLSIAVARNYAQKRKKAVLPRPGPCLRFEKVNS